jgi:hypothetical protein
MKKHIAFLLAAVFTFIVSDTLYSQSEDTPKEFGIAAGALANFPANKDYLNNNITVFYATPYVRTGRHEFSAGILYPLAAPSINYPDEFIDPRVGATAGYKFYIFNPQGRENLFVHYMFQYLRFKSDYVKNYGIENQLVNVTETDMYINNVIGLGYNIFFDMNARFGFYYTLDYIISSTGSKLVTSVSNESSWNSQFVWNSLSTNIGFTFKITSLKKNEKKAK